MIKGELINVNPRAEEIFKIPLISKDDNKLPYNVILSPFPSLIHILSESFSSKKNVDWNKTNIIIAGKEETIYYSISNIIDKSGKHLGITFLIQNINI